MREKLKIQDIHFGEEIEYLEQIEYFKTNGLETNNIYFKTLPGLGATTLEIKFDRNSIIIEPLQPVILGKQGKHPKILGVHKDISDKRIKEYLKSDITPKKIMTTPEGYKRVMNILKGMNDKFSVYDDFFLLFDECDRLITDKDYRTKISLPMSDFFKFRNKALISATALIPSDVRFKDHKFKVVRLVPDFDYKKKIDVIVTNNIIKSFRKKLDSLDKTKPIFIFLNSTLAIKAIIDILGLKDESKVFCSDDSRKILRQLGIDNTSSTLGDYSTYNFFTSRFFSSVDIDLDYKPDVIVISDLLSAKHSILDPSTEIIQITGRFRKPEGSSDRETTNSITHITNLKPSIRFWSKSQAKTYLKKIHESHKEKKAQLENAISAQLDEVEIHALNEEFQKLPFNEYTLLNGEVDYFLVDNFLHKQKVKGIYVNLQSLKAGYKESAYFKGRIDVEDSVISDEDNIKLSMANTKILQTEIVAERLLKLTAPMRIGVFDLSDREGEKKFLRDKFPDAYKAFFSIGFEGMKEKEFKLHKMKNSVGKETIKQAKVRSEVIQEVFKKFEVGSFYSEPSIKETLLSIYEEFDIKCKTFPKNLGIYFVISDRNSNTSGSRGHTIVSRKEIDDIQKQKSI